MHTRQLERDGKDRSELVERKKNVKDKVTHKDMVTDTKENKMISDIDSKKINK